MTRLVTGLFDDIAQAEAAARKLEAIGIARDDISLIAHGEGQGLEGIADDAGKGAGLGSLIGGTGGLLASLGLIAIPGIGPALAGGWLAALIGGGAVGAAVGGATGGLVGALVHSGLPEDEAHGYAEGVRRGGALLTARVADADLAAVDAAVHGAVDIGARADHYRQHGWTRFDEAAPPLDRTQLDDERASHLFV